MTNLSAKPKNTLNDSQNRALEILNAAGNVFLTGVAGSGKSYLVRYFLKEKSSKDFPVLASTGAAAILVSGRTFHSFFGLGIMQGGFQATVERALKNTRLMRRLKKTRGIVIDEISMISGLTLRAAETVARLARNDESPWGGLKVLAVGDFAQLPPVNPYGRGDRDWAFLDETWARSAFAPAVLNETLRTSDAGFIGILNDVRAGRVTGAVTEFLNDRLREMDGDFDGTVLFPHRETTEAYNLMQLEKLPGQPSVFKTIYAGEEKFIEGLVKNAPVPQNLTLKKGALVMIRQNDPQGRWCNGSLGFVEFLGNELLRISLLDGPTAELEKVSFSVLDSEGREVASATNFPVNLAYSATIHKAQGMTLDRVHVDLSRLWEPGQAYVALSRVKTADGLSLAGWSPGSIKTDPHVRQFNDGIWNS